MHIQNYWMLISSNYFDITWHLFIFHYTKVSYLIKKIIINDILTSILNKKFIDLKL